MKTTVKLSWSILNAWASGKQEDAVSYYLGRELPKTDAMELGWLKHKEFELFAVKNKRLPDILGGDKLVDPLIEVKHQRRLEFTDKYDILIRGVLDVEDQNRGIDYKVGKGKASTYTGSMQANIYKILRPNLVQFVYICYNPYLKTVERGLVFLTDKTTEDGLNFIYTYAGEMINYLESQKLVIDYKK